MGSLTLQGAAFSRSVNASGLFPENRGA